MAQNEKISLKKKKQQQNKAARLRYLDKEAIKVLKQLEKDRKG